MRMLAALLVLAGCPEEIRVGRDAGAEPDASAPADGDGLADALGAIDAEADSDGGTSIGAACPNGASDCEASLCLTPATGEAICTVRCSPDPPCPDGFACRVVSDGTTLVAACAPATGLALGELCTASAECEIPLCLVLQAGDDVGYCTDRCVNMICPAGYECVHFSDLNEDLCAVRDDQGDRAAGQPCFASVQCASAVCVWDPARRTGVCN